MQLENTTSSLNLAATFFNTYKGYITSLRREPLYNDEPQLFAYSAHYKTRYKDVDSIASGVSFDKERALMRVLGETLERYCLDNFNERDFITGSISDLHVPFLDPTRVISFSEQQLKNKHFNKFIIKDASIFRWVHGYSLFLKKKILVPAQLVFTSYQPIKNEPWILLPISTGAATGITLEGGLYRGICEIIERDAFMISYLNKLPSPLIDLQSIKNKVIANILSILNRYRLEVFVVDITSDLQIPAFASLLLDRTGLGPAVSVGLKAGLNEEETIIGAIEESLMVRSWIRDIFMYTETKMKIPNTIETVEDRACFWFKPESIEYLDFWLKHGRRKKLESRKALDEHNEFHQAITLLKKAGIDIFYVDITQPKMKKFGFTVVKVIIPQLHPFYLEEKYPYLGGNRLYDVSVKLGFQSSPHHENQLNKIPHPFL